MTATAALLPWWFGPVGFLLFVILPLALYNAWPTIRRRRRT